MTANVLPYGRQEIDDRDVDAVVAALRSAWLTTGPKVDEFERAFADWCGATEGVAVSSGTAALHAAMRAIGAGPGDEVIAPALTFAATANAVLYEGATPVFADVDPDTMLIDPASVEARLTPRTKAVIAVDYAGQPADYDALRAIARTHGLALVADACHAPGATYKGRKVGTLADLTCFSFHPVKHVTTCEGGMVLTDDPARAAQMRRFRNHGVDSDHRLREKNGVFAYDMLELGYNYRLSDLHCALGLTQLQRLDEWVAKRQALAALYEFHLAQQDRVRPLVTREDRTHARHLYVVRVPLKNGVGRDHAFTRLRAAGIGANVHYAPVPSLTYYRRALGATPPCPNAEAAASEVLTLPLYPAMTEQDVRRVCDALADALA